MSPLLTLVSATSQKHAKGEGGSSADSFLSDKDIAPTYYLCSAELSLKLQGSSFFDYQIVCSKHLDFPYYTQQNECSLAWDLFCFVGQKGAILLSRFPEDMARYLPSIFQSAGGTRSTV